MSFEGRWSAQFLYFDIDKGLQTIGLPISLEYRSAASEAKNDKDDITFKFGEPSQEFSDCSLSFPLPG